MYLFAIWIWFPSLRLEQNHVCEFRDDGIQLGHFCYLSVIENNINLSLFQAIHVVKNRKKIKCLVFTTVYRQYTVKIPFLFETIK